MDINRIVAELEAGQRRLSTAITTLKRVNSDGTRKSSTKRGRRLSAAARKRLSDLMKRRWAQGKMKQKAEAAYRGTAARLFSSGLLFEVSTR